MALLTIITATYNRAHLLKKLYQSLVKQTSYNFEWLVVDDGSTDDTKSLLNTILLEAPFKVNYIFKENGGKHTALNQGIKEITTKLTIIVDSDDFLLSDAVEIIIHYYNKYKGKNNIGVFCYSRVNKYGRIMVDLNHDEIVESYITYRIKGNRPGDMAEVFYTDVLKNFPFPEFPGERFLSEDVVWIQIGLKYKFVFIRKPVYQCDYLVEGLTNNDKALKFSSPCGSMMRGKMLMNKECGIIANIRGAIIYNCYKKFAETPLPVSLKLSSLYEKALVFFCKPITMHFRKKWEKEK